MVLGEASRVRGYRLAGATVIEASGAAELAAGWSRLPPDTALLILTAAAAAADRELELALARGRRSARGI